MGPAAGLPGAATSAGAAPGLAAPPSAFTRRGQPARRARVRLTLTGTRGDSPPEAGPRAVVSRGPRWRLGGDPQNGARKPRREAPRFPLPSCPSSPHGEAGWCSGRKVTSLPPAFGKTVYFLAYFFNNAASSQKSCFNGISAPFCGIVKVLL